MYEYARHEAKLGINVHAIAAGRETEALEETTEDRVHVARVPIDALHSFSLNRLKFVLLANRLIRALPQLDIVHVYAFPSVGLLPWLVGRRRAKWIYDIRSSVVGRSLGQYWNRLIRYQAASFDLVMVHSHGTKDALFGPGYPRAMVAPIGADLERFRALPSSPELRQQYGIHPDDQVLVYCGATAKSRHLDKLVEAFANARRVVPRLHLMVIGSGDALDSLQELAGRFGVAEHVTFTGHIPFKEIPKYYSMADIGLAYVPITPDYNRMPSLKLIEYLAAGLPAIATDTAEGHRRFVQNGENGILTGDDPTEFASAIISLTEDKLLQDKFRQTARDSVKSFDWSHIVKGTLIPAYEGLLGDSVGEQ